MARHAFDLTHRYVRVIEARDDGLVAFEFSVGEPEMAVELMMPRAAFGEFCAANQVVFLDGEGADLPVGPATDWAWRLHDATHQRFR